MACFWPVGLTPAGDEWRAREYRVLLRSSDQHLSMEKLRQRVEDIRPDATPVMVDLPVEHAGGKIAIYEGEARKGAHAPSHAPTDLALPVKIESESTIALLEAPIGEGFHWEHTETLEVASSIWVAAGTDGRLCAGAEIDVDDYLASVNSSEMPADAPLEFLKAQVVVARSWLLANWGSHHPGEPYIACAGDHCQCYYGQTRIQETSRQAVKATSGQVLTYGDRICDARYAKICGGFTEPAANVWPFVDEPYLGHFRDLPDAGVAQPIGGLTLPAAPSPDLSAEADFRQFQQRQDSADACCSPGYAPFTGRLAHLADLYRWQEKIVLRDLREIIKTKTGQDLGEIQDLVPGRRGPSGRLMELTIIGDQDRLVAAPELEIRRLLSPSHLPSSAFWVERIGRGEIGLHGLGWGHGVGLCQVGAAALAANGSACDRILAHYYPKTTPKKIY